MAEELLRQEQQKALLYIAEIPNRGNTSYLFLTG
jgi:hypothetical protein